MIGSAACLTLGVTTLHYVTIGAWGLAFSMYIVDDKGSPYRRGIAIFLLLAFPATLISLGSGNQDYSQAAIFWLGAGVALGGLAQFGINSMHHRYLADVKKSRDELERALQIERVRLDDARRKRAEMEQANELKEAAERERRAADDKLKQLSEEESAALMRARKRVEDDLVSLNVFSDFHEEKCSERVYEIWHCLALEVGASNPEAITIDDLARNMRVTPGEVRRLLDPSVREGFIRIIRHAEDEFWDQATVSITRKGNSHAREIEELLWS